MTAFHTRKGFAAAPCLGGLHPTQRALVLRRRSVTLFFLCAKGSEMSMQKRRPHYFVVCLGSTLHAGLIAFGMGFACRRTRFVCGLGMVVVVAVAAFLGSKGFDGGLI